MDAAPPPSVFDRFELPAASALLGWTLRAIDAKAGTIEIGFTIDERFANPQGMVQGGFIAAMLDDTHGPALFAQLDGEMFPVTVDCSISFLRAARFGNFIGRGRVISCGKTIAFTEGELFDQGGTLVARGTFTSRLVRGESRGLES
jgi:uncharacterized protein (TIGR00369 family)